MAIESVARSSGGSRPQTRSHAWHLGPASGMIMVPATQSPFTSVAERPIWHPVSLLDE